MDKFLTEWWNSRPQTHRAVLIKQSQGTDIMGSANKGINYVKSLWSGLPSDTRSAIGRFGIGAGASMIPYGIYKLLGGRGGLGTGLGVAALGGLGGIAYPHVRDYIKQLMERVNKPEMTLRNPGPESSDPSKLTINSGTPAPSTLFAGAEGRKKIPVASAKYEEPDLGFTEKM